MPGKLLLDGLEQPDGDVEAGLGAVRELRGALGGAEGAVGLGVHVEGPGRVPAAGSGQIGGRVREEREQEISGSGGSRLLKRNMRGTQFLSAMVSSSRRTSPALPTNGTAGMAAAVAATLLAIGSGKNKRQEKLCEREE
ncbi:hypothetical protein ZWY2020_018035 [Hordeum vulgare]|nr:hypothetical protein ZWY2020_018035 [Hordeum vulgare]